MNLHPRALQYLDLGRNPLLAIEEHTFANISSQLKSLLLKEIESVAYVGPGAFDGMRGPILSSWGYTASPTSCSFNKTISRVSCVCAADRYAATYPNGRRLAGGERGEVRVMDLNPTWTQSAPDPPQCQRLCRLIQPPILIQPLW